MANFQHPVNPDRSFVTSSVGDRRIKAINLDHHESKDLVFIEGVSRHNGKVLLNAGFYLPLADLEALCHAFLIHLDSERKQKESDRKNHAQTPLPGNNSFLPLFHSSG